MTAANRDETMLWHYEITATGEEEWWADNVQPVEEFDLSFVNITPALTYDGRKITMTAANGRWVWRVEKVDPPSIRHPEGLAHGRWAD